MNLPDNFYPSQKLTPSKWIIGQLVLKKKIPVPDSFTGTVGVVYQLEREEENDESKSYVAIILESGEDLNLIEAAHLEERFVSIGWIPLFYEYKGPDALMEDFKRGLFSPHFELVKQYIEKKNRKPVTSLKKPKARNG